MRVTWGDSPPPSPAAVFTSFALFYGIKRLMGVRVSMEEEIEGLDVGEHGQPAYGEDAA